jgi:NhaP-type Na+/H+ or K+/H+ antiporter
MHELTLLILSAFMAYSLLSKRISRGFLTLPILFTAFGWALSEPLAEAFSAELVHEGKKVLAEVTLVLVLFADASHVRFTRLVENWRIPARMLLLGMPMTILLGVAVVYLINPAAGLGMAILTAAVLTPTDAALGQSVVTSPDVPGHLRQTINVESGLNDGMALPFVLMGAILASAASSELAPGHLALDAMRQVALGPVAGIAIGWGAARAMDYAQNRDLMNEAAGSVVFLSSAFAAFALAQTIGGNGFIAAFVAGMVFGNSYRHDIHFVSEVMEGAGQLLTMAAFLVFGAFLLPDGLSHATPRTFVIAILFLTAVRMLPIFLSLAGTGLTGREKLFLGWFGPRGLASILFTLLMIDEFVLPDEAEFLACVSLTVGLSVLLHGVSAGPLSARIAKLRG